MTVNVSDLGGNSATEVTTSPFSVETTVPNTPTISGTSETDGKVTITGTAEADSTVTLTAPSDATYTTTATGGNWSFILGTTTPDSGTLSLNTTGGNNAITVTSTDSSGNVSSALSYNLIANVISAGSGGDPYVITLDNRMYKLPNFDGFARMLEGEYNNKKFIVNASCKISSQQSADESNEYITNLAKDYNEFTNEIIKGDYENINESFFDKIFIQWDNQSILFDLDKMKVIENNSNFEISKIFENNNSSFVDLDLFSHYKSVKGSKGVEFNVKIKVGDVNLILSNNSNPQFRTSFRIDNVQLIENPKGALVKKLYYKDFKIKKIGNNKKIIERIVDRNPRKIKKETYYQKISDNVVKTEKDIEIF